ncbi:MAG: hypothetical protein ACYCU0_13535 [Solirubrobacteraceae bacterium]
MSTSRPSEQEALLRAQRREIERLRARVRSLEAVVTELRQATIWDFSVYEQLPSDGWVAIDRDAVDGLLLAAAAVDDWRPWRSSIEGRPA